MTRMHLMTSNGSTDKKAYINKTEQSGKSHITCNDVQPPKNMDKHYLFTTELMQGSHILSLLIFPGLFDINLREELENTWE